MALVAYDYDSGSDNEEDNLPGSSQVEINNSEPKNKNSQIAASSSNGTASNDEADVPSILSQLPKSLPHCATNTIDDTIEDFVPKYEPTISKEKKPQKARITIPSLAEFDEDDEQPQEKRKKKSPSKVSGLLSILPPARGTPLSTISFVPNIVKNKIDKNINNTLLPHALRKKAEKAKTAAIKKIAKLGTGSDLESDDDIETPETFDDEMWQKVCGRKSKQPKQVAPAEPEIEQAPIINIAPEPVKPYDGLDNAAFKELVGKSKRPVNIKLVDINEEELLPDKEVWMTKALTDPDSAPPEVVEDPVDPTRKKKHHITYLAEQAKANEHELSTQWSASKYARTQTRAKYGF